jgi:hypothetical protein
MSVFTRRVPDIEYIQAEIEHMRFQVHRRRGEIRQLQIAVGLFWFAQGTGLLPLPQNLAMIDYGAGGAALVSASSWMAVGARAHLGSRRRISFWSLLRAPGADGVGFVPTFFGAFDAAG